MLPACSNLGPSDKGCRAAIAPEYPQLELPSLQPVGSGVYARCSAYVTLLSGKTCVLTSCRVSNYTYCKDRVNVHTQKIQSHVLLAWDTISVVLELPKSWKSMDLTFGLEDARIFSLRPGVILLLCTGKYPNDWTCRMVGAVVMLPSEQPLNGRISPVSVTFFCPSGGCSSDEKNWMGYVHESTLYMLRYVNPQQTVSVPLQTLFDARGVQKITVHSDLNIVTDALILRNRRILRGSTSLQRWTWLTQDVLIGLVHWQTRIRLPGESLSYSYAFILTKPAPPFEVFKVSKSFILKPRAGNFVFIVGLRTVNGAIVLDMGIDDCESASVSMGADDVQALLNDSGLDNDVEFFM